MYPFVLILSSALLIGLVFHVREMCPSHPHQNGNASLVVRLLNEYLVEQRYIKPGYWVSGKYGEYTYNKERIFGDPPWGFGAPAPNYFIGFDDTVRTIPTRCFFAPTSARRIAGIRFTPGAWVEPLTADERKVKSNTFIAWLESELASYDPASNISPPDDGTFLANVKGLYVDEEISLPSGYLINSAAFVLVIATAWSALGIIRCVWIPVSALIHRRAHRLRHGLCPSCGYNLHGLPNDVCPECGKKAG